MDPNGKFVYKLLPPANLLPCLDLEGLSQWPTVTTNKIEPVKGNCNHHNYSQQHLVS